VQVSLRAVVDGQSSCPIDIVHAVVYSLLLLNTDLHVAELTSRMSSKQFIRNTMSAIRAQQPTTPSSKLPTLASTRSLTLGSYPSMDYSSALEATSSRGSFEKLRDTVTRTKRSGSVSSQKSDASEAPARVSISRGRSMPVSTTRTWDAEMENLLKVRPLPFARPRAQWCAGYLSRDQASSGLSTFIKLCRRRSWGWQPFSHSFPL
jgi:hypothetical protein